VPKSVEPLNCASHAPPRVREPRDTSWISARSFNPAMSSSAVLGARALAAAKRDLRRALGMQIRQLRVDAGVTQTALGRASGVDRSHLSRIEAGLAIPSLDALIALGAALGSDLSVRLYPGSGPRIHDRFQAPMVEALIRLIDQPFIVQPEVAVFGPVRGVIDLVVRDPQRGLIIACEAQSELRRLEETLRRAGEKADALFARSQLGDQGARLLLLRSTADTRALANRFEATLGAAYPAATADVVNALRHARRPWPGSGVVWARVERGAATILDAPPRGVLLGRGSNGRRAPPRGWPAQYRGRNVSGRRRDRRDRRATGPSGYIRACQPRIRPRVHHVREPGEPGKVFEAVQSANCASGAQRTRRPARPRPRRALRRPRLRSGAPSPAAASLVRELEAEAALDAQVTLGDRRVHR